MKYEITENTFENLNKDFSRKFVEEVFDPEVLADMSPKMDQAMEIIQENRKLALDEARVSTNGLMVANATDGNAKLDAQIPLPVALWIAREAPQIVIDDKLWYHFLNANPGYKVGQR